MFNLLVDATTTVDGRTFVSQADLGAMVGTQAFIWIPIILTIVLASVICFMMDMDADKHKDTLLYAKFLANVKDQ